MARLRTLRGARVVLFFTVAALCTALIGYVARANHGMRTLDATPETQTATRGAKAFITVKLSSAVTSPVNIDFENENGVNDTDGTSRESPDESCVIGAGLPDESPSGTSTGSPTASPTFTEEDLTQCTIAYVGNNVGNDDWRIWIDHDGRNSTVEADTSEGRDGDTSQAQAGTGGENCGGAGSDDAEGKLPLLEPDCTDVVRVSWTATAAARVDCDDQSGDDRETNPSGGSGSSETYTCRVQDAGGNAVENTVRGEVKNTVNDPDDRDGASYDSPDYACHAVSNGTCDITVTQNEGETGTAQICFWVEGPESGQTGSSLCPSENTDEEENNDLADQVEKTWQGATPTGGTTTRPPTGSPTTRSPSPTGTTTRRPTGTDTEGPQRADREVTLATTRSRTTSGRTVVLSGTVSSDEDDCEDSETVFLTRRVHGQTDSESVGSVVTDDAGNYSLSIRPTQSADYEATLTETDECEDATSNPVTVQVRVKVKAEARPRRPRRGTTVRIVAKVRPAHAGTRVILQRKRGGRFVKVKTARLNNRSKAVFRVKAKWKGARTYVVRWRAQDEEHLGNRSGPVRIRTRRRG